MKKVYKYPFDIDDLVTIEMPVGAKVLMVDLQGVQPTIWALVSPIARKVERKFHVRGTGHFVENDLEHVGSFQQGMFVWHVFEDNRFE